MKRTAIICIAALLLTATGTWFIYENHLQVEADTVVDFNERQLTLVRLTGREVKLIVDGIKHKMVIASRMPSTIKGGEKCLAGLETFYGNLKEKNINLLFRLDDRGILTHCTPEDKLKGVKGKDFSFREYFKEIKRTGRPYISGMLLAGGEEYEDVESRFKTIFITVPLYNNGRFAGVLGASINLTSMLEKSISVRIMGPRGTDYFWAIDDRGIFIAHPIKEFIGRDAFTSRKERSPPDISFEDIGRIMREKMMKGEEGTDIYTSGWHLGEKVEIKKLIAWAPFRLGGRQYSVTVATPESKVISLSRRNFENTLITMAVIMVIMLSGLLYILNLDRRRIESLEREAGLAEGIKKSEEKYRGLFENSIDAVFTVDIEGNFTSFNRVLEGILGYSAKELMGKNYREYMEPETADYVFQRYNELFRTGKPIRDLSYEVIGKNGERGIFEGYVTLVKNGNRIEGFHGSSRDITKSEQARAEIIRLKEFSEKIVDSIPSSLLVLDRDLNIKSVNRIYNEIRSAESGKSDDVIGKNIKEVFSGDFLKEGGLLQAFEDVVETGETRRLYGIKHASSDHPDKILNITASGILRAEEATFIVIIEDVTERARLAEEIRKKNKELESFVYTISHDLRAPVISIQGFSSILLSNSQDKLDDTGKRYLARIHANVRQMEILIDDLLEFSRVGRIAGTFEDVPSAEIIRDVLDVLGPQLKKSGIKVDVRGKLPVIHCEKMRIFQVFENLIQNSIKYMGDTESPVIEIGCRKAGGFHEFYVKDNGIGIDPKYHQRIFQIFQRLKEANAKGTGVGLATVERITEVHGGSVRVESEKGKGATFYFTLPLVREQK